jgi:hypothetical protein
LAVRVKQDTPWLKTFTNSVTVDSNETELLPASVNVSTPEGPLKIQDLRILPKIIRRTGNLNDIQAVATLPAGFGKSQIRDVVPTLGPVLYPDNKIVAKRYIIAGTASRGKVLAVFDRAQLLKAVPGYGRFTMKFQGRFKSGRSFYGEAVIQISRFAGS